MVRQPIFDASMKVFAYDLFFRAGVESFFQEYNNDEATSSLISNSFFSTGIGNITGGNRAVINFTRKILLQDYAHVLPSDKLVVEINDDIRPDSELLDSLSKLKEEGYTIALTRFDVSALKDPLVDLASMIKIDFKKSTPIKQQFFARRLMPLGIKLVADGIESYEEYHAAKQKGYSLFQGGFFCKPTVVEGARIPESKLSKMRLLHEVNQADLDFQHATEIIKHDVALSYKLLRYTNSAYFGLQHQVTNIKQALLILGQKNLRKWASLMTVASLGDDKPSALLVTAIVRARLCELLAERLRMKPRGDDLFLMGMLSTIDALLDRPMEEAIEEISLASDVKDALLGEQGTLRNILDLVLAHEVGEWDRFEELGLALDIETTCIPEMHMEAVKMAESLFKEDSRQPAGANRGF
jgi:EAL and modified HD-GYP domain-containing signal transduction protein